MAGKSIHDPNQPLLPGFEGPGREAVSQVYDECEKMNRALMEIIKTNPVRPGVEDEYELCQEIAVEVVKQIRESGMTRGEFAEKINLYFGRTEERYALKECRKPLKKPDVDKWVSDYTNRPIDAYYLFAIQHVLGFGVANSIVMAKGGQVMSQEDRRLLALAQIGELEARIRDAKKALKQ